MTRSKSTYKIYSPIGIICLVLGILIWYVVLVDFGVKKKNEYILPVVMFDPTDTLTEGYPELKSLGCFGNELIKKLQNRKGCCFSDLKKGYLDNESIDFKHVGIRK